MAASGVSTDSDYDQQSSDDMEGDINDYYNDYDDITEIDQDKVVDPEAYEFELLKVEDVERLLNESVEAVCQATKITPALAKVLLHTQHWKISDIIRRHQQNAEELLKESNIAPQINMTQYRATHSETTIQCPVCTYSVAMDRLKGMTCGHVYCRDCWQLHFQHQIQKAVSTQIECMGEGCHVLIPEDFVLNTVTNPKLRDRYQEYAFSDFVRNHPELRFCPGPNCSVIVRAKDSKPKRVICSYCKSTFCFKCGLVYHAPTGCDMIKQWLTKCADDSETANYISANTKDCPKCQVCIEKNGGCNHMQCSSCKHDFCWMCTGDWKNHGSEYYECSRYKENPNVVNEGAQAQAREALKKYLFYFERWENHSKSLKLEEQTLSKIKERIEEKVMSNVGTWIDWQYLLDAASLLRKCRYTLQYTYPYAYYQCKGARKQWFESEQAQLEAEVENLSWKVERAEITDRGDLEQQMDIAEKRRISLVRDFQEEHV